MTGMHQGYWWENILVAILDKSASFVSFLVRQVCFCLPKTIVKKAAIHSFLLTVCLSVRPSTHILAFRFDYPVRSLTLFPIADAGGKSRL